MQRCQVGWLFTPVCLCLFTCPLPSPLLGHACSKENPKHKQRQGFHTDAAAAAAEQQQQHAAAGPAVAAAATASRSWLDGGASVGARLWQQLV